MQSILRYILTACSGLMGWFIGTFEPTFPLIVVAYAFILWDVQSAYALGQRVQKVYPDKVARDKAKFASFRFGKVVDTIIKATAAILLMFAARKWVCSGLIDIPLDYIAAAVVLAWQGLSVLENNASCPLEGDKDSRFWKALRNVLIDKTERHFDINLNDIKDNEGRDKESSEA